VARWVAAVGGLAMVAALIWAVWPAAPSTSRAHRAPEPTGAPAVAPASADPLPALAVGGAPADAATAPALDPVTLDAAAPVRPAEAPSGGGYRLARARGPRPRHVLYLGGGGDLGVPDAAEPDAGAPDARAPDAGAPDGEAPDAGTVDGYLRFD
jgi:hypothetical protein